MVPAVLPGHGVGSIKHRVVGLDAGVENGSRHLRGFRVRGTRIIPAQLRIVNAEWRGVVGAKIVVIQEAAAQFVHQVRRERPVESQSYRVTFIAIAGTGLGPGCAGEIRGILTRKLSLVIFHARLKRYFSDAL